jgi:hypothetical protein
MSACPCNLTKEEVKYFNERTGEDRVPLSRNICQNPRADGSDGVCGKALGAHPTAGISYYCTYSKFCILYLFCNYQYLVLLNYSMTIFI